MDGEYASPKPKASKITFENRMPQSVRISARAENGEWTIQIRGRHETDFGDLIGPGQGANIEEEDEVIN